MPRAKSGQHAVHKRGRRRAAAAGAAVFAAVVLLFYTTVKFPFLNWDDQDVFVRNTALRSPGLVAWAFTTTYIEHYQPLAWLTWGATDRAWGLTPAAAHGLNVALHAACAVLVFLLALRISGSIGWSALAALLFAAHPLRVEVVAWASAMPYSLALLFALVATLTFLAADERRLFLVASVALFALSLIARPIALGLPIVFAFLTAADSRVVLRPVDPSAASGSSRAKSRDDPFRVAASRVERQARDESEFRRRIEPYLSLIGFFVLALVAAYIESTARLTATVSEVGAGARLTLATTAPFRYLWSTFVPIGLTPLNSLALAPRADIPKTIAGSAALIVISWMAWRYRRRWPGAGIAWFSYIALLVPAMGLVPSGLQATADRYTYLAAVPLAIGIAAGGAQLMRARTPAVRVGVGVAVAAAIVSLAAVSFQQARYWRDSIALWTRAVQIDPGSDVALYNVASALAEAGRRDEALERYDQVLRIVPDHRDARKNGDLLRAAALEDEGNRLAASGKLQDAIERYRRATAFDPARTHAQAALGMALVQTGQTAEALPHLRQAIELGSPEPAVTNALAFSLASTGQKRAACDLLVAARTRFPDDINIARNLAQLGDECEGR